MAEIIDSLKGKMRGVSKIDWYLIFAVLPVLGAGLVTMNSFMGNDSYFTHQLVWILVSFIIFFVFSFIDFHFLRRTSVVVTLYSIGVMALLALFVVGQASKGAQSWIDLGLFSIQPSDPMKLVLIIVLAKYFSRRHVEIAQIKHIVVSGVYAFIIFALVALHPDFGSALTIFAIWFGMVMVSGISKKHLLLVVLGGAVIFAGFWNFGLKSYQKARIMNFVHPLADIRGSGYNAYQAMVTVGSGGLLGKGLGYGTQSRLKFLPEYETDFIFAAFAEEWGFVGVIILLLLFAIILFRIMKHSMRGESNFETLFCAGLAIFFVSHLIVNIGMNIGLLPVTGIPVPFMSYGGSHLVTEFAGLGIMMGMARYSRPAHRDLMKNEFVGY
jgi:rod shape determining protein RodA